MNRTHLITALGALALATAANADSVIFQADGLGSFSLNAGSLSGVLGGTGQNFSGSELRSIHEQLHGSGVTTDGFVTVLVANTDAGLTLLALVDDNTQAGTPTIETTIGFDSTIGSTSANLFINDVADMATYTAEADSQSVEGSFLWHIENKADALAWGGVEAGDDWSMTFADQDTQGLENGFQFVTWTGDGWEVVASAGGFGEDGLFSFSSTVVPLPAALGMGLVGLAAVATRRRRQATA